MIITTTYGVDGYHVSEFCGILCAEALILPHLSHQPEKWASCRAGVLDNLAKQGEALSADAIVSVQFEHVAGFTKNDYVFAHGTAVKLVPINQI